MQARSRGALAARACPRRARPRPRAPRPGVPPIGYADMHITYKKIWMASCTIPVTPVSPRPRHGPRGRRSPCRPAGGPLVTLPRRLVRRVVELVRLSRGGREDGRAGRTGHRTPGPRRRRAPAAPARGVRGSRSHNRRSFDTEHAVWARVVTKTGGNTHRTHPTQSTLSHRHCQPSDAHKAPTAPAQHANITRADSHKCSCGSLWDEV